MEELRRKLSERYMTISEHFNEAFSFMKYFSKRHKGWVYSIIILGIFSSIVSALSTEDNGLGIIAGLISMITGLVSLFLMKKIMEVIEERTEISYGRMWLKSFLLGLFVVFVVVPIVVTVALIFSRAGVIGSIIAILFIIASIAALSYYTLYFYIPYMTRNIGMIDAFRYNLHLSKGNRLKMFLPSLIYYVIVFTLVIVINLIMGIIAAALINNRGLYSMVSLIIGIPMAIFSYLAGIYMNILSIIIYLNVEYMDLSRKKDAYFEENRILPENTNIESLDNISENKIETEGEAGQDSYYGKLISLDSDNEKEFLNLNFRKSEEKDIDRIMGILEKAKEEIRNMGVDQWQDGYPDRETVLRDIRNGNSYLLEGDGKIIGTAALSFEREEAYSHITEGKWLTGSDYGYAVIHRIAVDSTLKNKGYGTRLLNNLEEAAKERWAASIRIDTHEENRPMRRLLEKNGYTYCGIVYLDNGLEKGKKRIALEKII